MLPTDFHDVDRNGLTSLEEVPAQAHRSRAAAAVIPGVLVGLGLAAGAFLLPFADTAQAGSAKASQSTGQSGTP